MPVRFRCVYCNQLLAIAHRKVGSVVRCTNCEGQIIVPEPEATVAAGNGPGPALQAAILEHSDLDDLLTPTPESAQPAVLTVSNANTPASPRHDTTQTIFVMTVGAFLVGIIVGILIGKFALG